MKRRAFIVVGSASFLSACSTTHLQTQKLQSGGLKDFKRAYIEQPAEDEFQVVPALIAELTDMGIAVAGRPFDNPTDTDLLVKVKPDGGWDLTRYLQSLHIEFVAAKSGQLVSSASFRSHGLWMGVRDKRLKAIFNDIREKNGYPPTKQFQ